MGNKFSNLHALDETEIKSISPKHSALPSQVLDKKNKKTRDWSTKQLAVPLSAEDYSKLQLLSSNTTIPLPTLGHLLLKKAMNQISPEYSLNELLFHLSSPLLVPSLSNREREILNLMIQGLSNSGIANTLDLREQTVKNHVSSILHKMNAKNRTQAVLLALKQNQEHPEAVTETDK